MGKVLFGKIISEHPWQKTADWDKREGMVAVLEFDGHRLEIHKRPFQYPKGHAQEHENCSSPPKTSRFWLIVDGVKRGSESPRVSDVLREADGMVNWFHAARALAPADAQEGGR